MTEFKKGVNMNIEKEVMALEEQMKKDKEYLWNNPEPGLKEIKTSAYIKDRLKEIGYTDINDNIYETGIVATLKGKETGKCILFRSDMDAVIMDNTGRTKHTCGHNAHMTILLSLAKLLMDNKDKIKGTVKLLFEPDEEGSGGATPMIEKGVLENPKVDKVFAIHVWSELKEGTVGIKKGPVMASTDPFEITVYGKGGHAGLPEKCVDTIYIANVIGKSIKEMAKIDVSPEEKIVLGVTAINGGETNNVIPNEVHIKGICRTFNNELRRKIKEELKNTVEKLAIEMGGRAELKFIGNYPATINSKKETEEIKKIALEVADNIEEKYQTMCSEDFSYFLEKVPGAMILVGCQQDIYYPQHSENFTCGMKPVLIGTQIFYDLVNSYLI